MDKLNFNGLIVYKYRMLDAVMLEVSQTSIGDRHWGKLSCLRDSLSHTFKQFYHMQNEQWDKTSL